MTRANDHLIEAAGRSDLRRRIGWICHGLRIAAAVWVAWVLVMVMVVWSDKAAMLEATGRFIAADLTGVSTARYALGFALALIDWTAAAAVAFCIWRLFGTYLAGRVFTVDAAVWLRRTGIAGITAVLADVLCRLISLSVFTGQLTLTAGRGLFVLPADLLHLIFALFVLALAHIFKAAAEMAEDHAQIV
jgi:hypothetical protein